MNSVLQKPARKANRYQCSELQLTEQWDDDIDKTFAALTADHRRTPDPDAAELVCKAISFLTPNQQEVVKMHYFEQLSTEEIASRLKRSKQAVNCRLIDAKEAMLTYLHTRGIYAP